MWALKYRNDFHCFGSLSLLSCVHSLAKQLNLQNRCIFAFRSPNNKKLHLVKYSIRFLRVAVDLLLVLSAHLNRHDVDTFPVGSFEKNLIENMLCVCMCVCVVQSDFWTCTKTYNTHKRSQLIFLYSFDAYVCCWQRIHFLVQYFFFSFSWKFVLLVFRVISIYDVGIQARVYWLASICKCVYGQMI